jgi:nucleotide-binding universal stress UspA family protein
LFASIIKIIENILNFTANCFSICQVMKQIIVAIDFSKTSMNALAYGIHIANKAKADVQMVWVDNTTSEEVVFEGFAHEERNEKVALLKGLQEKYAKTLKGGKLDYKTRKGKVYIEIAQQAKSISADLIIAGTHGVSGYEEFWIGSNAYRIVTNAPCPVITLRHDFKVNDIGKIVIPIDSSQETRQKIPVASQVSQLFNSEIHVLSLYSAPLKSMQKRVDNYVQHVLDYFKERKIRYVAVKKESENITRTTIDYAEAVGADLIAIMTEQENTTANIFLGPYAQQMVNHSPLPVLSMRSKELVSQTNKIG